MDKKVRFSKKADKQLENIFMYYLMESGDPVVARNVVNKLRRKAYSLGDFYRHGTNLQSRVSFKSDAKFVMEYSYAIIYDINDDSVEIVSIYHMSRDFGRLKKGELK